MLPLVPRERNTTSTTLPRNNPGIRRRLCTSEQSTALVLTTQQHEADKRPFLHRNGERQMLMDCRYNSQYKSIPSPHWETWRREGSILTRKKCVSSSDLSLADYGAFEAHHFLAVSSTILEIEKKIKKKMLLPGFSSSEIVQFSLLTFLIPIIFQLTWLTISQA